MEEINVHKVNGVNDQLEIYATDTPGAGGAYHRYDFFGFDPAKNPSQFNFEVSEGRTPALTLLFQNGGLQETVPNGITIESLLAICLHRLQKFQAGGFPCTENVGAILHITAALTWLRRRTKNRVQRGVEGKVEK